MHTHAYTYSRTQNSQRSITLLLLRARARAFHSSVLNKYSPQCTVIHLLSCLIAPIPTIYFKCVACVRVRARLRVRFSTRVHQPTWCRERKRRTNKKTSAKYVRTKSAVHDVQPLKRTRTHTHSIYTHTSICPRAAQYNLRARAPRLAVCGNGGGHIHLSVSYVLAHAPSAPP